MRGGVSIYYKGPAGRKGLGARFCLPSLYRYLSIAQINSLRPGPSHSVAECQSFRYSVKILASLFLLESPKKKYWGPNLLSVTLTGTGQSRHVLSYTSQLLECPSEYGCSHLFCVCIVADLGLATERSPFM